MRRLTTQQVLQLAFAGAFVVGGMIVGSGLTVALTPDPKPEIRTTVRDVLPACEEISPALQTERARLATLADATDNAGALAAGLDDVALTKDGKQIIAAAEELDEANRRVQAARLALATDQAATDAVVADCTPERPE